MESKQSTPHPRFSFVLICSIFSAAILITGGFSGDTTHTAEVFLPWSNTSCRLPSLPGPRVGHIQSGDRLCGGDNGRSPEFTCRQWSMQQGVWSRLFLWGAESARTYSSGWALGDSLIIMGGGYDPIRQTSKIVSSDGDSASSSFPMKYETR